MSSVRVVQTATESIQARVALDVFNSPEMRTTSRPYCNCTCDKEGNSTKQHISLRALLQPLVLPAAFLASIHLCLIHSPVM